MSDEKQYVVSQHVIFPTFIEKIKLIRLLLLSKCDK